MQTLTPCLTARFSFLMVLPGTEWERLQIAHGQDKTIILLRTYSDATHLTTMASSQAKAHIGMAHHPLFQVFIYAGYCDILNEPSHVLAKGGMFL